MGSKLSPGLADIYCSLMEQQVIKPHQINGNIIFYFRYVDDIIAVCLKNTKEQIRSQMNKFATDLKFTEVVMTNKEITFLDTCLYIDAKNNLEIKQYRKPIASEVLNNFKKSVMPKSQKIGLLMGEIYRANNTTSTTKDLNNALDNLTKIFLKNEYPESLITSKIEQIKIKNFKPSVSKLEKEREAKENLHKSFNLCLSYTHIRCEKVAAKIISLIRNITPNFRVNLCWKNIRLSNYFSPKLKLHVPLEEKNGTVYSFTCPCETQTYIGESKRQLYKRIYEHNRIKDSPIYMHIQECETYKSKISLEFGVSPTPSDRRNFIKNCFKPLCTSAANYYKRTRLEAIAIRLNSPPLNEQIHHKKVSII